MTYPTSPSFIDRKKQREQIAKILDQVEKRESRFAALEFYGIGGLGKSRILDEAKEHCRQLSLPFAVVDCLISDTANAQPLNIWIDILLRICDQLDHYFPLASVRGILSSLARNGDHKEMVKEFPARLAEIIAGHPLILMLDSVEHCPEALFDWLGQEIVAPLASDERIPGLVLFLAGRGQRMIESHWPRTFIRATQSFRLDPLDFAATEEHIGNLPIEGQYRAAVKEIYALSNGHPYSTEALVHWLNTLGIKVDGVGAQREALARRLYDEVIRRYIQADAGDWALPLLEIACIPRRFDAGLLSELVSRYRPELASNQPIQWYIARIVDLQRRPLNLVYVGNGNPAYELEPTLHKLLNTAWAILSPDETMSVHRRSKDLYEGMLSGGDITTILTEMLYHTAQISAISGTDAIQPAQGELGRLLKEYFRPQRSSDLQKLNLLKDRLVCDSDLIELLGRGALDGLVRQIDEFLQPEPAPAAAPSQLSHLVIEHFPPTEYRVSWYHANQTVLSTESVRSARRFTLNEWRTDTRNIGETALGAYLPARAQAALRAHRDWAIQLSTDWADIPWELLYDGVDFLCLNHPMARKPQLLKEPKEHLQEQSGRLRALVIGNPTADLPGAAAEAEAVSQVLAKAGVEVVMLIGPEQATANRFSIQITTQRYDLIHYAGHGYFDGKAPHLSGLLFQDGPFFAEEFERCLKSAAFVFLSACESAEAKTTESMTGFRGKFTEGVAISALGGGAIGCLGPIWEIEDGLAKDFALEFYVQLAEGSPIGEAVRQARLAVRDRSSDFWASWILYGDPTKSPFKI